MAACSSVRNDFCNLRRGEDGQVEDVAHDAEGADGGQQEAVDDVADLLVQGLGLLPAERRVVLLREVQTHHDSETAEGDCETADRRETVRQRTGGRL